MNSAYGYVLVFLIGACGAWYVQELRWDEDVASRDAAANMAIAANVNAVNAQLVASRAETEQIRSEYIAYKTEKENATTIIERGVADGSKRLRVAATCPATMPATGTVPGRTGSGTAELDASAGPTYFALRRGYDQQYGLLQFCRSELRKRSAVTK